ncbi:hypothetical protein [Aquimarina sp. BL5]|uniref:hypothetical protein n=1 Tax=Aquimarina sp. BL5 TaxID=1714860 RepID=UPI000EAA6226|nr:hypothetical protein [Aquimarina sp. BL5]
MSCSKKVYTIEQVKNLDSTHFIENNLVIDIIKDFDTKSKIYDDDANLYVLYVDEINASEYKISISKTDFDLFRVEKSKHYFRKVKGYTKYKETLVVLYGDIHPSLFKENQNETKQIMNYSKLEKDKNKFIIYEPNFVDYRIKDNLIVKLE